MGTRLDPLTRISNKHLLPVGTVPMIFHPIRALVDAGIREIMVVTGGNHAGDFLRLLGNGEDFGLRHIDYAYQKGEGGIADALALAQHFAAGEKIVVILGDNIFSAKIGPEVEKFRRQGRGARILLKKVPDPQRFGTAVFSNGSSASELLRIEEKPKRPKSNYIVTGIYMYDGRVFDVVRTLKPSRRGELEITDVNNRYLERGELTHGILKGWWTDCGTFDSLLRANNLVTRLNGVKVR